MTKFFDGRKTLFIEMTENGSNDFSDDFFCIANLEYDEKSGAYIVHNVDYLVDQAIDWENYLGDFQDDTPAYREVDYNITADIMVTVNYLTGNTFPDGSPEIYKQKVFPLVTRADLDNMLDTIDDGEQVEFTNPDGEQVDLCDIQTLLD